MKAAALLLSLLMAQTAMAQDVRISADLTELPPAVRQTRQALIDIARSGDIAGLRDLIATQGSSPKVSFGAPDDPVAYLQQASADAEGHEILAVLLDALDMPYAVLSSDPGQHSFAWPYLSQLDPATLTPVQLVDSYRLISDEDLQTNRDFGGWIQWRVFIGEDGQWQAFVAGD